MIEFTKITTSEELFHFVPANMHAVVLELSNICNSESMRTVIPVLRQIVKELKEQNYLYMSIEEAVITPPHRKQSISSFLLKEDEKRLVKQLEKESKRNKAIILLALRLGLRDCDITTLKFDAIDWKNDTIAIRQQKTGESLKLPLLPDVGNALFDYIKNERSARNDGYRYIFLRNQAPHNRLTSIYHICFKLLHKLNIIPENGGKSGTHSLRYSLVHKLLAKKIPHQVITDLLGHTSKESDKPYLSMEESMLRQCPLDLSLIGSMTWEVNK